MTDQPEGAGPTAPPKAKLTPAERHAGERDRLLSALASGKTDLLHERVAWLLSRLPNTRDSDIALQLAYWEEYEPELMAELENDSGLLFKLTRLTSIARARAKIQNTHRLFQASPDVRKRRGQLTEEERERYARSDPPSPTITIFADESGKTDDHLVVGSVWFLDPADTIKLMNAVRVWRERVGFENEFHFSKITDRVVAQYEEFVERVFDAIPLISFKSIDVPRAGIASIDAALDQLFFELIRRGVEHEHESGRAPLPRRLMVWKDRNEEGRDRLMLARLCESLTAASAVHFDGRLKVEECESVPSEDQPLMQLADLYTGSINRVLGRQGATDKPKDRFADYLLARVLGSGTVERSDNIASGGVGDMTVHLRF
jgi:hypothetical protein